MGIFFHVKKTKLPLSPPTIGYPQSPPDHHQLPPDHRGPPPPMAQPPQAAIKSLVATPEPLATTADSHRTAADHCRTTTRCWTAKGIFGNKQNFLENLISLPNAPKYICLEKTIPKDNMPGIKIPKMKIEILC